MKKNPLDILNLLAQTLFDKKGVNILALDVRTLSTMTDYFLIAEGRVHKHVIGLARGVINTLKDQDEVPAHVEGLGEGDWVVIDCYEIVVHIFTPGLREKYRIEELWSEGEIVDLVLDTAD